MTACCTGPVLPSLGDQYQIQMFIAIINITTSSVIHIQYVYYLLTITLCIDKYDKV